MRSVAKLRKKGTGILNRLRRILFGCKWTPRAAQAAALSRREAAELKHDSVHEIHFTLALGHMGVGFPAEVLNWLGFQYDVAMARVRVIAGEGRSVMEPTTIPFSHDVKDLVARAQSLSMNDGLAYFGTDHLILALLQKPDALLRLLMEEKGIDPSTFRGEVETVYRERYETSPFQPPTEA